MAPAQLLATLAHEVAHDILLGGGHLTGDEPDHETTTDLLPAFLGVGVFGANATLYEYYVREGNSYGYTFSTQGYLTSIVHGYALALFAYARGEAFPAWRHHLRTDARKTLTTGLRFLRKTGDSLFTPDAGGRSAPTPALVLDWLTMRSPTFRFAALSDIVELRLNDPRLLEPVARNLNDSDDTLRARAVNAATVFGPAASELVPQLVERLGDRAAGVRSAAARALGILKPPAGEVVVELARLLLDEGAAVEAAGALAEYGAEAAPARPKLLDALEQSLSTFTDATPLYFTILRAICADPETEIRKHFGARDPDLLRMALNELKDSG